MSSVSASIGAMQRKLLYPSYPDVGPMAETLIEVIDEKVLEMNLGRAPRYVAMANMAVNASQFRYSIAGVAPDYDNVRYVYGTVAGSSRRYPFEVVPLDSLTEWYEGTPVSMVPPVTAPFQCDRACAVWLDTLTGLYMLDIAPIPTTSYTLTFVSEVATARPQSLDDTAFHFPQFDGYVTNCAALQILPQCRWKDCKDEGENEARRRTLAGSVQQGYGLVVDKVRGDGLYWKWRHSEKNPGTARMKAWGQHRW